jgi:hypothetical protein
LNVLTTRLLAVLALASLAYACGGDDRSFVDDGSGGSSGQGGSMSAGGDGGTDSSGGTSSGGSAGKGGTAGSAGTAGAAGSGGDGGTGGTGGSAGSGGTGGVVAPPDPGRPGFGTVSAGRLMTSPNYSVVASMGDSPGGNQVFKSPNYRVTGGLIGSMQP